jgi:GR25 family glycosyltransferase involved in LPS biosynthesis
MKPTRILEYINRNLEYIIFFVLLFILAILITRRGWEGFITEAKGINQLDAIIYINLENRSDRKDLLLKELESLDTNMSKVHKVSGVYMPKNGHKGCIQSHILALNMIKLNQPRWSRVLILEDDAELTEKPDQFNEILSQALAKLDTLDPNWNVLMLATAWKIISPQNQLDPNPESQALEIYNPQGERVPLALERLKKATTSSAYIVKASYVDEILKLFDRCNNNMKPDKLNKNKHEPWALDQQWASLQERDRWYCLSKDPVKQREIWSTILKESHT